MMRLAYCTPVVSQHPTRKSLYIFTRRGCLVAPTHYYKHSPCRTGGTVMAGRRPPPVLVKEDWPSLRVLAAR